jgi:iron(III) transport system substrate-binding protein
MSRKLYSILSLLLLTAMLLTACGGAATPPPAAATEPPAAATEPPAAATDPPAANPLAEYGLPDYYPADYISVVEGSQQEMQTVSDGLIVYSIMGESNWAPVLAAFYAKFPWMQDKVTALDLGSYEVFERYYSESASNARTGDMIITSSYDAWQEFIANGNLVEYTSPEDAHVPDWSKLTNGMYTFSSDPMILIYNKQLVASPPASLADLAALITADTAAYKGKVTTYDVLTNATGFAINWFWLKNAGEPGWETLAQIGQSTPTRQSSAGNMVNAVISGEALAGYFVSAISVFPKFPDAEPVLGWSYITDGQPILVRGQAITAAAKAPNSAKLLMDFVLSAEGQIAISKGGLTAYRDDMASQAERHLSAITEAVGADNMVYFFLDPELLDQAAKDAFLERWDTTVPAPSQ